MTQEFGRLNPLVGAFLYRGQVTIAAGGPYAGKSRMSLHLANSLASDGKCFLGDYPPMKVLYCSERSWDFNSEQLRTVGLQGIPPDLRFVCIPDIPASEWKVFESCPTMYLTQAVLSSWAPDLVVLDTTPHFQAPSGNQEPTNSYSFNRRELLKLNRWAVAHDFAVLALFHSPKQREDAKYTDPFDRILGSTAILASSIAACILERLDDAELCIHFRSHVGVLETPRYFAYGDLRETRTRAAMAEPSEFEKKVLALIPEGDWVLSAEITKQIAATLEKSANQVRNAIDNLIRKYKLHVSLVPNTKTRVIMRIRPN